MIKIINYDENKKELNKILSEHQEENKQEIYQRKEEISLAVYNKDTYAGGLVARLSDQNIHIERLGIDKEFRRHGYGKQLINEMKKQAKEKDCNTITVSTLNFQGKDFYLNAGFKIFGELKDVPKKGLTKYYLVLYV